MERPFQRVGHYQLSALRGDPSLTLGMTGWEPRDDRVGTLDDRVGTLDDRVGTLDDKWEPRDDRVGTLDDRVGSRG